MGGKAFPALNVVRLTPEQWTSLSIRYRLELLKHFRLAEVLPEAPEKQDHGDIDVVVAGPLNSQLRREDLAKALTAAAHTKAGSVLSFALYLPKNESRLFQLDVGVCKPDDFVWQVVMHSYGDLWHIIGSTVIRFGLVLDNRGLHVCIEEIEQTCKKDSLVLLTNETTKIFKFLGLDAEIFDRRFSTLDEVFQWATKSRLFRRRYFIREVLSDKEKRIRETRPMYGNFVKTWLPQNPECGLSYTFIKREDLLAEALETFNRRPQYEEILEKYRKRLLKDKMWRKIAKALPLEGKKLGEAIVALKALLVWNDGKPKILQKADRTFEKVPALADNTVDEVLLPWVREHWKDALAAERAEEAKMQTVIQWTLDKNSDTVKELQRRQKERLAEKDDRMS